MGASSFAFSNFALVTSECKEKKKTTYRSSLYDQWLRLKPYVTH